MSPLPAWRRSDLPHPPKFTLGNAVREIGPGTLLLGVSFGAGDWLRGPAVTVTYGATLLWLCTMSVILQAVLDTEMARYTLATAEPIFTGFMRTPPGPHFWGWSYALLHLVQVGWPGWALVAGSAHTLWVNRTLLLRELRPPLWRQAALLVCGCFFAGLAWAALGDPARILALFAG